MISSSTRIISEAFNSDENVAEVLDNAERLIFDIRDHRQISNVVPLKEIIKDSIETIDKLYQRKAHVTGIPTGYVDFDVKTAGLQPSDLIIVAGRPSMGKSALVIGMIEYAAVIEKSRLLSLAWKCLRNNWFNVSCVPHAKVDAHKVRTGFLSVSDWPKLTAAAGKLSEAPYILTIPREYRLWNCGPRPAGLRPSMISR